MSAPTLDHTATAVDAISMDGATAAAVGAAGSTGIVSPTTDSPNALPISRELVDSGAPTRTDVLNVLLSRSEGWQAWARPPESRHHGVVKLWGLL